MGTSEGVHQCLHGLSFLLKDKAATVTNTDLNQVSVLQPKYLSQVDWGRKDGYSIQRKRKISVQERDTGEPDVFVYLHLCPFRRRYSFL